MITMEQIKAVNAQLRADDDSHKWPLFGKINATDQAIGIIDKCIADGLEIESEQDYYNVVYQEAARIVNDQRNW